MRLLISKVNRDAAWRTPRLFRWRLATPRRFTYGGADVRQARGAAAERRRFTVTFRTHPPIVSTHSTTDLLPSDGPTLVSRPSWGARPFTLWAGLIAAIFFVGIAPTLDWLEFSSGSENLVVGTVLE